MFTTLRTTAFWAALIMTGAGLSACGQDPEPEANEDPSQIQATERPVIETAADMPRTTFDLPAPPSQIVIEGGAAFDSLKAALLQDTQAILEGYVLKDVATEKGLRSDLRTIAFHDGRWRDVLDETKRIAALEDKPAARATAGLFHDPYAEAALAVGDTTSDAFKDAFRAALATKVNGLDYALTQDVLQANKGTFEILTPELFKGSLEGSLDPNAEAQGMTVTRDFVSAIVGARRTFMLLDVQDVIVEVLKARIDSETEEKPDLWTGRLVNLGDAQELTPVIIGVWDSGTDPSVFGEKMWVNADETADGADTDSNGFVDDLHGIAFDTDFARSTGALKPLPDEDVAQIGDLLQLVKGALDLQASVESDATDAFRKRITGLSAQEVLPFQLQLGRLGLYIHGTATAFTAQETNPAAQVMFSRFDFKVQAVPAPFDEPYAEAFIGHIKDSVAYFKSHGARVVNMSWRITIPQIEASLASIEPDVDARKSRAAEIFKTMNEAMTEALTSAPEILFVAGAGNEDEDVEFVRSFPAGINLPNLVTVGAVDVALKPAGFTSYGKSIDLYANGFEVPSKVPGGMPINISGTSLAAPQVANLAAKLLALQPELSVEDVVRIMTQTATQEGERTLPVIHPAAAIASLEE